MIYLKVVRFTVLNKSLDKIHCMDEVDIFINQSMNDKKTIGSVC